MRYAYHPSSHTAHERSMTPVVTGGHPAPMCAREIGGEDWPLPPAMAALVKLGEAHDWECRAVFSRGFVPGRAAGSLEVADMVGVWLYGHGVRARGTWERRPFATTDSARSWTAQSVQIWPSKRAPFPYANHTDLKELIKLRGAVLPSWYAAIRQRILDRAEAARVKAKQEADEREAQGLSRTKPKVRESGG